MKLPEKLGGWSLMRGRYRTLWSSVGTVKVTYNGEDHEWEIGRSETSLNLYLFTDLPHPADPAQRAVFEFDPERQFELITNALVLAAEAK